MALALVVDSLDSVPEAVRGEYAAKDGKFHLTVDGLDAAYVPRDVHKRSNDEAAQRRHALSAWEKLGKTPDEIAALVAAQEADATDKLKKKGDFDAILKQHTDRWAGEKTGLETRANSAEAFAKSAIVETSVMGALTKAKVTPEGVDLLTERLGKRIVLEIADGKRKIQIMQPDGVTPMAGSGADGSATFDDLVKEAVKTYPSLFEGANGGGGGTPPKHAGGSGKTLTRKEFDSLAAGDKQSKIKAGFQVVD